MSIAQAFHNFFSFLSGSAPQVQPSGQTKPVKVREDDPVAAKRERLQEKRLEREGNWAETQFFQN